MSEGQLQTPVAFIVFNRPDHTRRSLDPIRKQRPRKLFVIGDGPRADNPDDQGRVDAVRSIVSNIDWPCDVRYDFAESNMGLKRRVVSGLDWVFANVEQAIILEDDCVAHPDFFWFCNAMLSRFHGTPTVGTVNGGNFTRRRHPENPFFFSRYPLPWGWATWRRAWQPFDPDIRSWQEFRQSKEWKATLVDPIERRYWRRTFDLVFDAEQASRRGIDSWSYAWTEFCFENGLLSVTPGVNLVANVGFGPDSTHTPDPLESAESTQGLGSLDGPSIPIADTGLDREVFDLRYGGAALRARRHPMGFAKWLAGAARRNSRRWLQNTTSGRH